MEKLKIKSEHSNDEQKEKRKFLVNELSNNEFIKGDNLINNLGLFLKTGSLSQILFLNEVYLLIKDIPGSIIEFGCWYGQNIIIFENLRAIYEPFNKLRKIVGFDTFEGYPESCKTKIDKNGLYSGYLETEIYNIDKNYNEYLEKIVNFHEENNVLPHIKKNEIIKGNIINTLPIYLNKNNYTVVSLVYLDLALYEPTIFVLKNIIPYLVKGSIIILDEFNHPLFRGDTLAFREIFKDINYEIKISQYMREKTIIKIK
jgi:hypothetical protein